MRDIKRQVLETIPFEYHGCFYTFINAPILSSEHSGDAETENLHIYNNFHVDRLGSIDSILFVTSKRNPSIFLLHEVRSIFAERFKKRMPVILVMADCDDEYDAIRVKNRYREVIEAHHIPLVTVVDVTNSQEHFKSIRNLWNNIEEVSTTTTKTTDMNDGHETRSSRSQEYAPLPYSNLSEMTGMLNSRKTLKNSSCWQSS